VTPSRRTSSSDSSKTRGAEVGHPAGQGAVAGAGGEPGVQLPDHAGAGAGRGHDRLVAGEHVHEAARERSGLALVAGVVVHLPAAGLLLRELDPVAEALEQPDDRLAGLGEHRVVEAGDEQGDTHAG